MLRKPSISQRIQLLLKSSRKPHVAIMIHHQELIIIEMEIKNNSYHLEKLVRERLNPSWFDEHGLKNLDALSIFIKSVFQKNKFKNKEIIYISDDPSILSRIFTVPKRSAKWITEYLRQEVKKYVLFSGIDVTISWKILDTITVDNEAQYRILAASSKSTLYSHWHKLFKKSGLHLIGVSNHTLGLEFALSILNQKKSQVIVSIEPCQTITLCIQNGQLLSLHINPISYKDIVNNTDAIIYLEQIINRSKRTMPECNTYFYSACNSEDQHKNLLSLMSSIGIQPLTNTDFLNSFSKEASITASLDHYISAMACSTSTSKDVLLVDSSQGNPYLALLLGYFIIVIGVLASIILCIFFVILGKISSIDSQITGIKKEIQTINQDYEIAANLDTELELIKNLSQERKILLKNKTQFNAHHFFNSLPTLLNEDVRLDSFKLNSQAELALDGEARSAEAAFSLIQSIKKSSYFVYPELKEVIQNEDVSSVKYIIKASLGKYNDKN